MLIDFLSLNENVTWQRIAVREMLRLKKITEPDTRVLEHYLDFLEKFNDNMIAEFKDNVVKTH